MEVLYGSQGQIQKFTELEKICAALLHKDKTQFEVLWKSMDSTQKVKYNTRLQNLESQSKENYIKNKCILIKTKMQYHLMVNLADPFS